MDAPIPPRELCNSISNLQIIESHSADCEMETQGELDPYVWSKLPQELLECIFARLPTAAIARLRALSKTWRIAASSHSAFTRACGKAQPDLYAVMWFHEPSGRSFEPMYTKPYDTVSGEWLGVARWDLDGVQTPPGVRSLTEGRIRTHIETADWPDSFFECMVCDGGLVCLGSLSQHGIDLLPLIVGNPLTRSWRQLPVHRLVKQIKFVQLKVDRESRRYSVVIVGHVGGCPHSDVAAELYDSSTNQWSRLGFGRLLAFDPLLGFDEQLQVFDCATEKLRNFPQPQMDAAVLQYATHRNDLYALEELPGSGVSALKLAVAKYENGMNWRPPAPVSRYYCELADTVASDMLLLVSEKFFVVVRNDLGDDLVRLMMVFGGEWHESEWEAGVCPYPEWECAFCGELRWDACP